MLQYFVMDKEFLYTDEYILIPSLSAEDLQEVEDSHRRISGGSSAACSLHPGSSSAACSLHPCSSSAACSLRNQERLQKNQSKEERANRAGGVLGTVELKDTGYTSTIGSHGKQDPMDEDSREGLAQL